MNKESVHLIEMPKSLSLGPCATKTLVFKKKMSSDIETTHFIETPKSHSLGPCAVKSLVVVGHVLEVVKFKHAVNAVLRCS